MTLLKLSDHTAADIKKSGGKLTKKAISHLGVDRITEKVFFISKQMK